MSIKGFSDDELQDRHDAFVAAVAESLDIEAGLAEIIGTDDTEKP